MKNDAAAEPQRRAARLTEGNVALPAGGSWITQELIDDTIRVWSPAYDHRLNDTDAVEILVNVGRWADFFVEMAREEMAKKPGEPESPPAGRNNLEDTGLAEERHS